VRASIAHLRAKRILIIRKYQPLAKKHWYEGLRNTRLPDNLRFVSATAICAR